MTNKKIWPLLECGNNKIIHILEFYSEIYTFWKTILLGISNTVCIRQTMESERQKLITGSNMQSISKIFAITYS